MLYLLENGADIDMFNNHNNTPFFLATESLQKEICEVWCAIIEQSVIGVRAGGAGGLQPPPPPNFWATQIFWAAR